MKFLIFGLMGLMGLMAQAADTGFAVGTTNGATTLSYAVVPIGGSTADASCPRVQFINAGSDLATGKVQFYSVLDSITATYTNSTTTLFVNTTNTVGENWQAGTVLIRHLAGGGYYEKRTLAANTGSTNIVVTVAPLGAVLPGDIVYYVSTTGAGTIFWGASTNSLGGSSAAGLYVGQRQRPLLLEINATTAGAINVVSGDYIR